MNFPEYHFLFSNEGDIDVHVVFEDGDAMVPPKKMQPQEVSVLVASGKSGFHQLMKFDDWPCTILKYEIDPTKNRLTIVARKIT